MDFSQPQRQAPIGVLVMFLDTIRQFAAAFWPVLVIYFVRDNGGKQFYLAAGLLMFLFISSVAAYLKFLNFTFFLIGARSVNINCINIYYSLYQCLSNVYLLYFIKCYDRFCFVENSFADDKFFIGLIKVEGKIQELKISCD